ncbi:MAG: fibronectin type III domain-containing protein [Deltaproteobacteria bacterium]|nr:fibronectin type III domain-containing protein [Deltaproteobacteria bacterium]
MFRRSISAFCGSCVAWGVACGIADSSGSPAPLNRDAELDGPRLGVELVRPPSAPLDVRVVADAARGVRLTWKPPRAGAPLKKYIIRTALAGERGEPGPDATSFELRNLEPNTFQSFVLSAVNEGGEGPSATSESIFVKDGPPTPGRVTACKGNAEIFVFVGSASNAKTVTAHVSLDPLKALPGVASTKVSAKPGERIRIPALLNGVAHYYSVTAEDGIYASSPTKVAAVTPRAFKPVKDVLFASTFNSNSVEIFDAFSTRLDGVAPTRTLAGPTTGLDRPRPGALAVSALSGDLYVGHDWGLSIFADAATVDGNAAASRALNGPRSQVSVPTGIAYDSTRNILYMVQMIGRFVARWDDACNVSGEVAPTAQTSNGSLDGDPTQIALDEVNDRLYVAAQRNISVFEKASELSSFTYPSKTFVMGAGEFGRRGVSFDALSNTLYVSAAAETEATLTGAVFAFEQPDLLLTGTVVGTRRFLNQYTGDAAALHASGGKLFLIANSADRLSWWSSASSMEATAPQHTAPLSNPPYSSVFYVP